MGQKVGKAKFTPAVDPFLNLPKEAVDDLWEAFNDVAEGFGVDIDELKEIFVILQEPLDMAKKPLGALTEVLFKAFDTDNNDLTDALELLGTTAACSGMTLMQKLNFLFNIYDFDESGELTIDEITLLLKSTLSGLAKVSNDVPPTEPDIELVAQDALKKAGKDINQRINKEEFLDYCRHNPDVRTWLYFYDDPPDISDKQAHIKEELKLETPEEGEVPDRSPAELAVYHTDFFVETNVYSFMGGAEDPDEPIFPADPWRVIAKRTAPANPPPIPLAPPDMAVELDFVHGVRCHDVRGSVHYTHSGDVVFMAATVGITYNIDKHVQHFFMEHSDEIISIAVHAETGRTLVATGEVAPHPQIKVWDAVTLQPVYTIQGFHKRGVTYLAFSPDGKQLLSVGCDLHHSVALYQLDAPNGPLLVYSGKSHRNKVLACGFTSATRFMTGGVRHAYFWEPSPIDGVIERRKGLYGKVGVKTVTCITQHPVDPDSCVSGTDRGQLLVWKGRNCVRGINGHEGAVNVIRTVPNVGVLTGGADAKIRIWFRDITPGLMFDIRALGSLNPSIRSLAWDSHNNKILVGTMAAEVWEISDADGSDLHAGPMLQGHFKGELCGLHAHPTRAEFCTAGDDQTLRVWDAKTRKLLRLTRLDSASRAVSYSANGKYIALGLGRPRDERYVHRPAMDSLSQRTIVDQARKYGAFAIMDQQDLSVLHETRDSKQWIQCIKFSPDGSTLAVGSSDKDVYLYNTEDLAAKGKCRGHTRGVARVDFSNDSNWLITAGSGDKVDLTADWYSKKTAVNLTRGVAKEAIAHQPGYRERQPGKRPDDYHPSYEMMFWDANTGEPQRNAVFVQDLEWGTYDCNVGWSCMGAWSKEPDEDAGNVGIVKGVVDNQDTIENASSYADRYVQINCCALSSTGKEIAACDEYGRVRIARYPWYRHEQEYLELRGHAAHVTNAIFLKEDSHLITVGGQDRCIFQWKVKRIKREHLPEDLEAKAAAEGKEEGEAKSQSILDMDLERVAKGAAVERSDATEVANADNMEAVFAFEEMAATAGDKFMTVKPWVGSLVTPTKPPPMSTTAPDEGLVLEWVHGARLQDCRQTALYTRKGEIVYAAAAVGVVMRKEKDSRGTQRFYSEHTDDIMCVASHPETSLIASGQLGKRARILLWDPETLHTVAELHGHSRGVSHCVFSHDEGRVLASIGMDDDHTLILHDWANKAIIGRTKLGPQQPLAISFCPGNRQLLVTGDKFITQIDISGRNFAMTPASLGTKAVPQDFLSIGWAGRDAIIGCADGHLYRLHNNAVTFIYDAHNDAVNCIFNTVQGMVTGAKDGGIKLWNTTMELQREFDMAKTESSFKPEIRSLCWMHTANKLLIGTGASELYELSSITGTDHNKGPIVSGHFAGELWGLDTHPTRAEFVTVGDDCTVRIWDLPLRKVKASIRLECAARSVSYSPDGLRVAVGLGGAITSSLARNRKDGGFVVLDAKDLSKVHEGRDSKQWITDIKYTPDGNTLALASADSKVYLYDIGNAYTVKGIFDKHNSFVTHIDFSADSQFMQSNCGAYELLFSDASNGAYIPGPTSLKDVQWESFTCTLGWPVQGVWPKFNDGTEIHSAARSRNAKLLAVSDNFGRVRLLRYPCIKADATDKTYRGHSADVYKVRWTTGDTHVLSIGGKDRSIMQWRVQREPQEEALAAGESGDDSDLDVFDLKDADGAEETAFMTVKPWVSVIVAPSASIRGNPKVPDAHLELDWVHGFRAQDTRGNLRYNMRGDLVYPAASVGVIFDKQTHLQDFHTGHSVEVASLAVGPFGKFAATGDLGRRCRVHIWNAITGDLVAQLPVFHRRGIMLLAFSPAPTNIEDREAAANGIFRTIPRHTARRLVSIGLDDDHTMAVWRTHSGTWEDVHLESYQKTTKLKPMFATWPLAVNNGPCDLVTGGVRHLKFWTISGRNTTVQPGIFGQLGKLQPLTCAADVNLSLITGTVTGHLYVWNERTIVRVIKAHTLTINDMYAYNGTLVTGSKDGGIKLWDKEIINTVSFNIAEAKPAPYNRSVRSVCLLEDRDTSTILVGTKGSEIYEISRESGRIIQLSATHCKYQIWGVAAHPTDPDIIATTGDDNTVRVWTLSDHAQLAMTKLETMSRCVAWSPDGSLLAVGIGGRVGKGRHRKDGAFVVLNAADLSVVHEGQDSRDWIRDIKFSPDGSLLAIGSEDTKIYVYDVGQGATRSFTLRCKCERHNSYITHLDFDTNSAHIRSNCGANELIFYRTSDGEQIAHPSDLKDNEWATNTVTLSWATQAVFATDGTDVMATDIDMANGIIATVDDFARVKLFRYPCINKEAQFAVHTGHSSVPTNVRFSTDASYLITTGGIDRTIMQWRVVRAPQPGAVVGPEPAGSRPGSAQSGISRASSMAGSRAGTAITKSSAAPSRRNSRPGSGRSRSGSRATAGAGAGAGAM